MCRLLGVVASETTEFRFSLAEAPRSLAALSVEHPDGWGLAVHRSDRPGAPGWDVHRHTAAAGECERFRDVADTARGELLVAHIRKRTVGPVGPANTHPFRRGRFVFAHNGTIRDLAWFVARTSPERAREVEGDTDSERFFAFLLTRLDEAGALDEGAEAVDRVVHRAVDDALSLPDLGAVNFLLSEGANLWAFRAGRTLHLLERGPGDRIVVHRRSHETPAQLDTPWTARRYAALVSSEQMTGEPWREVAEHTLLRVTHRAGEKPLVTTIRAPR